VLERATKQRAEAEQLRGTIDHQKQMVRNLQQRIKEAKNQGGARVELEFALSKERSEHESLLEVATQLELRARQHSRSRPVTDTQARLLRHSSEKAEMLAVEIARLQSHPVQDCSCWCQAGGPRAARDRHRHWCTPRGRGARDRCTGNWDPSHGHR